MNPPTEPPVIADMVRIVLGVIIKWLIVPLILLSLLNMAKRLANSAVGEDLKVSAWAGFWAGLVIFVILVISLLSQIYMPTMRIEDLPGIRILPLLIGFFSGFVILLAFHFAAPTRLVGLITLLLSATSSSALFSYIFLAHLHAPILYLTLGLAVGVLVHIVMYPAFGKRVFDLGAASVDRVKKDEGEITAVISSGDTLPPKDETSDHQQKG